MVGKTLPDFAYHAPTAPAQALALLAQFGPSGSLMLGGTDLISKMKARAVTPDHIISLMGIPEFKNVFFSETEGLRIGCAVTLYDLERQSILQKRLPALYEGVHCIASTQIRCLGTLAGNICNAVPSADSAPALLVLDAKIRIISEAGERLVPIDEFFTGGCRTVVQPGEIVSEIIVPTPEAGWKSVYYPHTLRRALDLAIVGVAAAGKVEDGQCEDIRIALGAVAVTPKRADHAEELVCGRLLTDELIEEAALAASLRDCAPISDMRASREYRQELVRVLTKNALLHCRGY